jgi:dTDP-4-amino-4,6-dideoxygalactose transaminase
VSQRIEHPAEWPVHSPEAVAHVARLAAAGRTFDYRYGPELSTLEQLFSDLHGGRHALAVNSGTSALLAAYHALGIGPGDEVAVPSLTFLATASPLLLLGAVPVLCDADGPTGNVSAETIRRRLTHRTKAIVVTHLFGHPCPMREIMALARERDLPVVEDCSHAHGSTYHGQRVGTFGDLAAFSIGGLKLISGGMGGVLLTRHRRHHEIASLLTAFQQRSEATVTDPALRRLADVGLGANLRISPLAAVLATGHLRRLDELVEAKSDNITRLLAALTEADGVDGRHIAPHCTMGGWYDAVVSVDPERAGFHRDELVAALQDEGVRARVPRTAPLHRSSVFRGDPAAHEILRYPPEVRARYFAYPPDALPASAALHDSWVSLPATFFNERAGVLVDPYRRAIRRALDRLGARSRSTPTLSRSAV